MKVHFVTPTRISLINLTTIGDSEKREDMTKIGKFSSGQAYATALLLRDGVGLEVSIHGGCCTEGETYTEFITYSTTNRVCESTNKSKEVITLDYQKQFHGNCNSALTFSEGCTESETIETAFALQLGYNWEIWMALRELWSNMLDEGGYVAVGDSYPELHTGTVITLTFDEDNQFFEVWQNRHLYINGLDSIKISDSVEALENPENYLRIYKQNILVYENREKPSRFAWNIKFGEIDERRILNDIHSVETSIISAIQNTSNEHFLRQIITSDFQALEKEFLVRAYTYSRSISNTVKKVVEEVYEQYGNVDSYQWLMDAVKKQKDCKIQGKKITTIEDSLWGYSREVTVETIPQSFAEPSIIVDDVEYITPFAVEINKHYNFNLDVEVKVANLKGSKVVADKYAKCLIVDESFSVEEDFAEFIVQYLDLVKDGNVIKSLSEYICNLIKK
jgi:hypothetical protein